MRNETIDCAKGFLMILVVLGHVITLGDGFRTNDVFRFCYSFHMYLFMYISGWLVAHKDNNCEWIKKRFYRLIIPYTIWSVIFLFYINTFEFLQVLYIFTDPVYWYLIVLFGCDVVLMLSQTILMKVLGEYNYKHVLIIFLIVLFILNICSLLHYVCPTIIRVAGYYPFYFAGWFLNRYKLCINRKYVIYALILYPISMVLYGYEDRSKQVEIIYNVLCHLGLVYTYFVNIKAFFMGAGGIFYNHFIVAPLGCIWGWELTKMFMKIKFLKSFLKIIGINSLQIYILSAFFQKRYTNVLLIDEILSFILEIILSIVVGLIIARNKKINRLLFGV